MIIKLRSYRIAGYAIFDIVATVAGAALLAKWTGWNFLATLIGTFVAGELTHLVFAVDTKFLRDFKKLISLIK